MLIKKHKIGIRNDLFPIFNNIKIKNILPYLIVVAILTAGIFVVSNNYKWYDTTIVKIEKVDNSLSEESKSSSLGEKHYDQTAIGLIMNGTHQGASVTLQTKYSSSGVFDDEYKPGDEVFIKLDSTDPGKLTGSVEGLKRDKYLAILLSIFIMLVLLVTRKKGIFSILSLAINIGLFCYALNLYSNGHNILFLTNCLILLFTSLSLLFISGFKKKTFVAIFATLLSLCATMVLFKIVMASTGGVDYAFMEYMSSPNDLPEIFLSQILLGGLGAIMDVAITEASTIHELIDRNKEISLKELIRSGREVGYDIMGTMINVMLFTYICGSIPLIVLKMNSDIRLHTIILWHMPMELYRFFVGSIGILLTIPISLFLSILIFKKTWRFR